MAAGNDGPVLAAAVSGEDVPVATGVATDDVGELVGRALRSAVCEPLPADFELDSRIVATAAAATTAAAPAASRTRWRGLRPPEPEPDSSVALPSPVSRLVGQRAGDVVGARAIAITGIAGLCLLAREIFHQLIRGRPAARVCS